MIIEGHTFFLTKLKGIHIHESWVCDSDQIEEVGAQTLDMPTSKTLEYILIQVLSFAYECMTI